MKTALFAILLGIASGIFFYKEKPTDIVRETLIYEWHYYDYEMSPEEVKQRFNATLTDTGMVYNEEVDSMWVDETDKDTAGLPTIFEEK